MFGAVAETLLLSFALTDRFNTLKKEKKQLIDNQNVILEKQVTEKTLDLQHSLTQLQITQQQLTDQQKQRSRI